MSEIVVLEDVISESWVRYVHLMSDAEFGGDGFEAYGIPGNCEDLVIGREIWVWHLRAAWRIRQAVRLPLQGDLPAVAWALEEGDTIRGAVREAAVAFALAFGRDPEFVWVERLPRGVEDWVEVEVAPLSRSTVTSPQMGERNLGGVVVELIAAPEVVLPGFVLVH